MKPMKAAYLVAVFALVGAIGVLGLAGCSSGDGSGSGRTGGVAATVNGTEIAEDKVTDYIQAFRASQGVDDEQGWGTWLVTYSLTPSSVREEVINYYADEILVEAAAKENDVSVSDEEVDEQVNSMKNRYADEDAWKDALSQAGTTEEDYRESVRSAMLQSALEEKITSNLDNKVSDEELLQDVAMYADYFSGAKKSSHILFSADDADTAQKVLDAINNGTMTFEDAVAEYSQDEVSAADGGNVGWDLLSSFVSEYTDALSGLNEGEMSDLVTSEFGIHIIKCTEEYTAPEEVTSLDQVPTELVDYIREMADSSKASENYNEWFNEYRESADIVINDMPSGLPYDIDMTPYQTSSSSSSDTTTSGAPADDATVEVTTEDGTQVSTDVESSATTQTSSASSTASSAQEKEAA